MIRLLFCLLSAAVTAALCYILDTRSLAPAPIGKLLSPQEGIWQNAEPLNEDYAGEFHFPQLEGKTEVYLDDRLVPHVFAEQENDAYFVQGYLHARFRLWQMEFQTYAAAGRLCELVGDVAIKHDREFRRLGMVYGAENFMKAIEKDKVVKAGCDAYTAGVNAYINTLTKASLPIEYKLIGYQPEPWSNLKTALFLKYMCYDLAAAEDDFEMTNAKSFFNKTSFDLLFPAVQDSLDPIIPKGTVFAPPAIVAAAPPNVDSVYFNFSKADTATAIEVSKPDPENGSNNWAVSGSKTQSGAPILCNDPHLGLNLPSLWFEMQISVPAFNAYGATFPGAPGVIIGFNDSCAFGFTNGGRDVRDYYEIKFKDESRQEYWFDSAWQKTTFRIEQIKVKGKQDYLDTVAYTIFGPVMYDATFNGKRNTGGKSYAVRWTAHDESNDIRIFYMLNRAKNYYDYLAATQYLKTPGQNCIFASKAGDIALRTQGNFPAKWEGQGDFVMPGTDSRYLWQGMIPDNETPYQYNPTRGFVSSANQRPVDTTYPYYLGRVYPSPRGFIINRRLSAMQQANVDSMKLLQTDNYNVFAEMAISLFLQNIRKESLNGQEKRYFDLLQSWNLRNDYSSEGATVFNLTWASFKDTVFNDEYASAPEHTKKPLNSTLLEACLKDSAYLFLDDRATAQKENLADMTTIAFKRAVVNLIQAEAEGRLKWGKYKDTYIQHLARAIKPFSRFHLPIGGGEHIINATKENHGPSWRMIVHLNKETEAWGIYPGGQQGNPSSKYYDQSVDKWAAGEYYRLWMMKATEKNDQRIKWKLQFSK